MKVFVQVLTIFIVFISGCGVQNTSLKPGDPPNIIWINAEDLSPAWGCYGDQYATTPNLDQLAKKSVLYRNAFATAPICSSARSCLITGLYATSLGTQHLRSEIRKPDFVRILPELLCDAGYFTTLYGKTDYNFSAGGMWDDRNNELTPWRKRKQGQPFFSMFTFGETHEGSGNLKKKYLQSTANLADSLRHDPALATVPPYFPDEPEMRELWARYYDLITVFDQKVGEIIQYLKDDGLLENTVIFVFADHGFGMPRYKRWLNESGLKVPLLVYTPEKYQHLAKAKAGEESEDLVSFVDFSPTVLNLVDLPIPAHLQGQAFLGPGQLAPRKYVYGARSRADDMYEVSRAVRSDRYIYIRHYMPYLPYIQSGFIFSDRKESFRSLRKLRRENRWHEQAEKLWKPKPVEELYDLLKDPFELNNLAEDTSYREIKKKLHRQMHDWILASRDVGFLAEPEYMIRSEGATPYEMAQDTQLYDLPRVLQAAELVGKANADVIAPYVQDEDSGVRFWAAMALLTLGDNSEISTRALQKLLQDPSPSVQIIAAEALCKLDHEQMALPVLKRWVLDERPWLALQAARSIQLVGKKAQSLTPTIQKVLENNLDENGPNGFKDFNFAAFTSWALEWSLKNFDESTTGDDTMGLAPI